MRPHVIDQELIDKHWVNQFILAAIDDDHIACYLLPLRLRRYIFHPVMKWLIDLLKLLLPVYVNSFSFRFFFLVYLFSLEISQLRNRSNCLAHQQNAGAIRRGAFLSGRSKELYNF